MRTDWRSASSSSSGFSLSCKKIRRHYIQNWNSFRKRINNRMPITMLDLNKMSKCTEKNLMLNLKLTRQLNLNLSISLPLNFNRGNQTLFVCFFVLFVWFLFDSVVLFYFIFCCCWFLGIWYFLSGCMTSKFILEAEIC